MEDDLVKRLRSHVDFGKPDSPISKEAAKMIEVQKTFIDAIAEAVDHPDTFGWYSIETLLHDIRKAFEEYES